MAYIFKLSQQADVAISSAANNDILQYNSSTGKWENHAISGLGLYSLTVDNSALKLDSGTTYNPGSAARTISHATTTGYKHVPTGGEAANWLKWSSDGTAAWTALATLSTDTTKGLKIGGSTTGTYTPNTTAAIEVDFTQVQALITNPVTGTGTQWRIAYWSSNTAITSSANFTIDTDGNVAMGQNLTITGNLTINGTMTSVNTTNMEVTDSITKLAKANTANSVDIGFYWQYQPSSTVLYGGMFRDASDGYIKFFQSASADPVSTNVVNEAATGYAYATLKAYGAILTAPAGSSTSVNYITWNASSGALEYVTLEGQAMHSWNINAVDSVTGNYPMHDNQSLAIIGDGAAISAAMADGTTLTKKLTITHATTTGYKHVPTSGSSKQILYWASDGTAQWGALSSVDGIAGTLTAGRVTLSSGTNAVTDDANLTYDTTADALFMNCGQRWAIASKAEGYTLTAADFVVKFTGSSSQTVVIPSALFTAGNHVWIIKQEGTGAVVIDPEGSQTVEGAATYTLPGQGTSVIVMITGSTTAIIL